MTKFILTTSMQNQEYIIKQTSDEDNEKFQ